MRLAEITGKSEPEVFAGIFGMRQAYGEPGYQHEWRERVALPVFSGSGRLTESRVTGKSERSREFSLDRQNYESRLYFYPGEGAGERENTAWNGETANLGCISTLVKVPARPKIQPRTTKLRI